MIAETGMIRPADSSGMQSVELPVLGIPVRFSTNEPEVLRVVSEAFGRWHALDPSAVAGAGAVVRVVVRPGADDPNEPIAHTVLEGGRLLVHSCGVRGITDPEQRAAVAHVTRGLVRSGERFRYAVLEALTLALLTRLDRQPLHASAIARGGAALLLHGRAGTGKSTLALCATHAGATLVADGTVYLQRGDPVRVWGMPSAVHLRPDGWQPHPCGARVSRRVRDGVEKVAVHVRHTTAGSFDRCGLCLLGDRRAEPLARRVTAAQALAGMDLRSERGYDLFAATIAPLVSAIADNGAWLLHPATDPTASVPLLLEMLDALTAAGAANSEIP